MREAIGREICRLGQRMMMYSNECPGGRGFYGRIEPISRSSTEKLHVRTRAGGVKRAEFLLIAESGSFPGEETGVYIVRGDERFELVRADRMMLGDELCHWEGILRLSGKAAEGDV